jgi:hypothetical protein
VMVGTMLTAPQIAHRERSPQMTNIDVARLIGAELRLMVHYRKMDYERTKHPMISC